MDNKWNQANNLAKLRGKDAAGRKKETLRQRPVPVETGFYMERPPEYDSLEEPAQYAARMYQNIRALGPVTSEKSK